MKLLVGSVFLDHPRSKAWYSLQMQYLRSTTHDFDHVVYLNGTDNFYDKSQVLKVNHTHESSQQRQHIRGLNFIVEHFNLNAEYDNLLLLDSDCFPIQNGWQHKLFELMGEFPVAAVARYENLDTFAHPSAFFVKRPASEKLRFEILPQKNIIGYEFSDTSSNITEFFPLIRTNKLNYHPVLCGIYGHSFYHHGAGSRNFFFKLYYSYFNETTNVSSMEIELFNELIQDSEKFIQKISSIPFDNPNNRVLLL